MTTPDQLSKAQVLKAEGNAFYGQKNYNKAYEKYTQAIKEDPGNAILYANRAACCLATKDYLNASTDAREATELDPTFLKAWARLATASEHLAAWTASKNAWTSGLSQLPDEALLSPEQKLMKTQMEEGLKRATDAINKGPTILREPQTIAFNASTIHRLPWVKAQRIEQQLIQAGQPPSSAFVMLPAYRAFIEGVGNMKKLKRVMVGGQMHLSGTTGVLESISNALLQDERVFHVDIPDWFDKYSEQAMFEIHQSEAWGSAGPQVVKDQALVRVETGGWSSVRRALSVTIRAWIVRGYIDDRVNNKVNGPQFFRWGLDVLEWGRKEWADITRENRGTIFDLTFVRAVRRLYLESIMNSLGKDTSGSDYTIEGLMELAREMITEIKTNPPQGPTDPVMLLSFWKYPAAAAHSIEGWCQIQLGRFGQKTPQECAKLFYGSYKSYLEAAELYPVDDEKHTYFLNIALEALWWCEAPLRVTLPLCDRIKEAMPEKEKIWEVTALSKTLNLSLKRALEFAEDARDAVDKGDTTLDFVGRPEGVGFPPRP